MYNKIKYNLRGLSSSKEEYDGPFPEKYQENKKMKMKK
jgi:hypothetical protein